MLLRGAAAAICGAVAIASTVQRSPAPVGHDVRPRYAAVAFDYFVLFNPDSIVAVADRVAAGKGREFTNIWRTRQFEYSWLRSITNRYVDFSAITEDALRYTEHAMDVELTGTERQQLLDAYRHLTPWPDTEQALRRLRESGVRVITIANFSPEMLRANIVFAAFGGWDAAGAKSFGYPTVWVNRFNQPVEELGLRPDRTVTDLNGLLDFVLHTSPAEPSVR